MAHGELVEGGVRVVVADRHDQLVLVGGEDRPEGQDLRRQRTGWGRVQDDGRVHVVRGPQDVEHRVGRDLVVGEHDIGIRDGLPVVAVELERRIGARRDGDLVLTARADDDEGDAGRLPLDAPNAADVDALLAQRRERTRAVIVAADGADHRHARSRASRGDGLIRALAAVVDRESAAEHGLAGSRKAVGGDDQVDVDGADDDHVRSHWRSMRECTSPRALPSSSGCDSRWPRPWCSSWACWAAACRHPRPARSRRP